MDRRQKHRQARRAQRAKQASAGKKFERGWAVVVYRNDGRNYEVFSTYGAKADAKKEAQSKTLQALDDAHYVSNAPYIMYFAVRVEGVHLRNTPLYPALKGEPGARAIVLFKKERRRNAACGISDDADAPDDADASADESSDSEKEIGEDLISAGGPIQLH